MRELCDLIQLSKKLYLLNPLNETYFADRIMKEHKSRATDFLFDYSIEL